MDTVTSEDLRWELTRVAEAVVAGKRVVVTYRGKPSFALVPLADLEALQATAAAKRSAKTRRPK